MRAAIKRWWEQLKDFPAPSDVVPVFSNPFPCSSEMGASMPFAQQVGSRGAACLPSLQDMGEIPTSTSWWALDPSVQSAASDDSDDSDDQGDQGAQGAQTSEQPAKPEKKEKPDHQLLQDEASQANTAEGSLRRLVMRGFVEMKAP